MSNFSFSHIVFKRLVPRGRQKVSLCGNGLRYTAVENIVRKGETACTKQFLLFSQCFLPYMALIFHFRCTSECPLQFVSIWASLKFSLSVNGLIPTII